MGSEAIYSKYKYDHHIAASWNKKNWRMKDVENLWKLIQAETRIDYFSSSSFAPSYSSSSSSSLSSLAFHGNFWILKPINFDRISLPTILKYERKEDFLKMMILILQRLSVVFIVLCEFHFSHVKMHLKKVIHG